MSLLDGEIINRIERRLLYRNLIEAMTGALYVPRNDLSDLVLFVCRITHTHIFVVDLLSDLHIRIQVRR